MKRKNIIIVGGGASGMVAAIAAARAGAAVTIIERKEQLGKKLLSTGNGRCNLTNDCMDISCFRGENTSIVPIVLEEFGVADTCSFFRDLGMLTKNKEGYIYPLSNQATTVLDILRFELYDLNVMIHLDTKVFTIEKKKEDFIVSADKVTLTGDAVILATGGKAASILGSDGSGYELSKSFGHTLAPVVPALVQLRVTGISFKSIAGVRTEAQVKACIDGQVVASDRGELQLTEYGLSGIPVFQISRYLSMGVYEGKKVTVIVDFLPSLSNEELLLFLNNLIKTATTKSISELLIGVFPKKLIGFLLHQAQLKTYVKPCDVTAPHLEKLLHVCKGFSLDIQSTNSFEQAQVCAGGVRTTEINQKTMHSLLIDNLYLTGELLDIDGICGGYNLQWAWSTGYIAGVNAAKGIQND